MADLRWDDSLLIGIDEIDEQHKQLFRLANELQEKLRAGDAKSQVDAAIRELITYIQTHFTAEERLMVEQDYPGLAEQQAQHRGFIQKIALFIKGAQNHNPLIARDILLFLRTWYTAHISTTDRTFGEFMNERQDTDTSANEQTE